MTLANRRGLKALLLAAVSTILITHICIETASHLFSCYYREQWGASARILHSPPYGRNYTDKLALVRTWATCAGIAIGVVAGSLIGEGFFPSRPMMPIAGRGAILWISVPHQAG